MPSFIAALEGKKGAGTRLRESGKNKIFANFTIAHLDPVAGAAHRDDAVIEGSASGGRGAGRRLRARVQGFANFANCAIFEI